MPGTTEPNIARVLYDAYPHSDLLPLDPEQDCRDLGTLLQKVQTTNIGDTLFKFLVIEMVEGGEGKIDGAIRVIEKARDDLDVVLQAFYCARAAHLKESPKAAHRGRGPRPTDLGIWRCPDCHRTLYRSYKKIAEAGSPYCPGCGHEMQLA